MTGELKLLALEPDDVPILSAHVQDAVVKIADMGFSKKDRRFALLINRYAWETPPVREKGQRRRAVLRFERVMGVQSAGIDLRAREGVLELLSLNFVFTDNPAGYIELVFAGGGTVRLEVECLEARLRDLGGAWAARARPEHDLDS